MSPKLFHINLVRNQCSTQLGGGGYGGKGERDKPNKQSQNITGQMDKIDNAYKHYLPTTEVVVTNVYIIFHSLNYPHSHEYFKNKSWY